MRRAQRLGRGKDIDALLRRGRRITHTFFMAVWRPNAMAESRFAFIIPRAVDKRATVRNRLRRRMREFMRVRAAALRPPLDIAITCRKEAARVSRREFYACLEKLLDILGKK